MTLIETLRDYAENMWPQYYIAAGEHKFSCQCGACTIFLAFGLETADSPEWAKLREEECPMEHNDHLNRPMGIPTDRQRGMLHDLARRHL